MEDLTAIRDADRQTTAALLLAITHLPFGLSGLATILAAEADIGPLTAGFEDVLLDNLDLTQKQAKAIASVYRRIPHVSRAIAAEAAAAVADDDGYPPPCTSPEGIHDWPDVEEHERCLCTWCGADGDA